MVRNFFEIQLGYFSDRISCKFGSIGLNCTNMFYVYIMLPRWYDIHESDVRVYIYLYAD